MTTARDRNLAAYLLTTLAAEPPAGFVKALAGMLRTERNSARGIASKQDSPPVVSASDSDAAESPPGELAQGVGLATSPPVAVTFRTKLLELDASHEDMLLRIALEDGGFVIGRQIALLLFEEVEITIRKVPSK